VPRIIEIDGGLVSVVNREVSMTVPLEEWLPLIERRVPVSTPVLPTNVRALWWDETDLNRKKLVILIEREPQIINLNMAGAIHRLSIPWTRFFFHASTRSTLGNEWVLDDYRLYWSNKRFANSTANDMLPALLPNIYEDARICFGSTGANAQQSIADRLDQIVNEFYTTTFNGDLTIRRPNGWRGWANWERMTTTNPMGWLTWTDWTTRPMASWADLCGNAAAGSTTRNDPMVAADGIPDIPLGATFGRINEWFAGMDTPTRHRLLIAARAFTEDADTIVTTDDETDDEDEDENA
jgi:hypothetical protein